MIEVSIDRADIRPWLVSAGGDRWVAGVRRFAPALMPPPLVPSIEVFDEPSQVITRLTNSPHGQALVLWQATPDSMLRTVNHLVLAAQACPTALQLVAGAELNRAQQAILLELPCATVVRHLEDLTRLEPMLHSYFHGSGDR